MDISLFPGCSLILQYRAFITLQDILRIFTNSNNYEESTIPAFICVKVLKKKHCYGALIDCIILPILSEYSCVLVFHNSSLEFQEK